ncbi:MAG TPA: YkgJ family cysteine cluster protein [Pyrinomonadaceae bacterium]|nr:YkgJ family cysteine cluster protein [Pyrinomonadaceae bacterium]
MNDEEMLSGELQLEIGGERFDLELTIPATPVKPQRMLPVLQQLTGEIVARGVERVNESGKAISCKAACGACCRQPLLISEAEAFDLAELVESMPLDRRRIIKDRFRAGREHFASIGWYDRFDGLSERAKDGKTDELGREFVAVLQDYIKERVACPFLENESCSIYEDRPLVCREYLVTSPAENCANPRPDNTEKIQLSGSPSKAFASLVKTPDSAKPSELLLIRLLEFAELHTDKYIERSGPEWMDGFFQRLTNRDKPGLPDRSAETPG